MASADPFQQVVDEAAKQTAEPLSDQHKPEPVQIEPPATSVQPPSNIQIVSEEPEPTPVPSTSSPTDANSLNSLIDALMDSSKPQAPPQGTNIIIGSPSAPPPQTPTIPGTPPPGTPPQGKKKSKTGLIIATILILLITLPIGIYFISQQRQLTEQRSKAATDGEILCGNRGGVCTTQLCSGSNLIMIPDEGCGYGRRCCRSGLPTSTKAPYNTPVPSNTPIPQNTTVPSAKSGLWGPCARDADCISNFCGATGKCVQITERCYDGKYMAPDGDPCACPIERDGVKIRDPKCEKCDAGTKINCKKITPASAQYTLKSCDGTQTCTNGTYGECIPKTNPEVCTGGTPISGTTPSGCTFPPQVGEKCKSTDPNDTYDTTSGRYTGMCAIYRCPNGCVKGKCGEDSPGFTLEFVPCTTAKLQQNECGQIDTVNQNNSYCIPQFGCDSRINCPSTCTLTITQPPSPSKTPTKTPTATATSTSAPTATGTIQPTATGTTAPTATGTTAPTATETSQPTATTTTIASCSQSCGTDSDCDSGLVCYTGMCRKPECLDEEDCSCPVAIEDTPVPETPVTGVPSVAGIVSALGGILLIIIGLLL